MKKPINIFPMLILLLLMGAQTSAQSNWTFGSVTVEEESAVTMCMEHFKKYNKENNKQLGYRILVLSTADRQEAEAARSKALGSFRKLGVDIDWEAPFYQVKVGHFPNRMLAFALMREMGMLFPSAYLLVDEIMVDELYGS